MITWTQNVDVILHKRTEIVFVFVFQHLGVCVRACVRVHACVWVREKEEAGTFVFILELDCQYNTSSFTSSLHCSTGYHKRLPGEAEGKHSEHRGCSLNDKSHSLSQSCSAQSIAGKKKNGIQWKYLPLCETQKLKGELNGGGRRKVKTQWHKK